MLPLRAPRVDLNRVCFHSDLDFELTLTSCAVTKLLRKEKAAALTSAAAVAAKRGIAQWGEVSGGEVPSRPT